MSGDMCVDPLGVFSTLDGEEAIWSTLRAEVNRLEVFDSWNFA